MRLTLLDVKCKAFLDLVKLCCVAVLILCLHRVKLLLELSFPEDHVVCFILSLAPS